MSIHKYYKVTDDGKLIRLNQFCPRCGPGFFMAQNYDRNTCGHCGYTDFKKRAPRKEDEDYVPQAKPEEAKPKAGAAAPSKKKRKK